MRTLKIASGAITGFLLLGLITAPAVFAITISGTHTISTDVSDGVTAIDGDDGSTLTILSPATVTDTDSFTVDFGLFNYTLNNSGTIDLADGLIARDSVIFRADGEVINTSDGVITGSAVGIRFLGNGVITNDNRIESRTDSLSVIIGGQGTLVNNDSGVIATGINISQTGMITNTGIITGNAYGIFSNTDLTLVNLFNFTLSDWGRISATSGTAIQMGIGDNTLTLSGRGTSKDPNFLFRGNGITGNIDGDTGIDTVILKAHGELNNTFVNFELLSMQGESWRNAGTLAFDFIEILQGEMTNFGNLTGEVNVVGGTLVHRGSLTGPATIFPDGTLRLEPSSVSSSPPPSISGNVINFGTIDVRSPLGVLNVMKLSQDYTHEQGAHLKFRFNRTGTPNLSLFNVAGNINIKGGKLSFAPNNNNDIAPHTVMSGDILNASSITGWFDQVRAPAVYDTQINRSATTVHVTLTRRPYETLAKTANQQLMARFFDQDFFVLGLDDGVSSQFHKVKLDLQKIESPEEFRSTLNQLTGEPLSTIPTTSFAGTQMFTGSLTDRLAGLRFGVNVANDPDTGLTLLASADDHLQSLRQFLSATNTRTLRNPMAAEPGRWVPYIRGFGVVSDLDATTNNQDGFDATTGGALIGADKWISNRLVLGGGLGWSHTKVDFGPTGNEGDVDSYKLALYAGYSRDNWYADGILSYSFNRYDNQRLILGVTADSDHRGHEGSVYAGGGYMFETGDWVYGPTASLQFTTLAEESYEETGGGGLGLAFESNTTNSLRSTLGGKLARVFKLHSGMIVIPEVRARWAREWLENEYTVNAQFVNIAGSSFEIRGRDLEDDSLYVGAGLTATLSKTLTGFIQYDADLREQFSNHIINGGLKIKF
ncbi:MAG: autotransporter domain-containing protein [Nitrospinaceae bacterium]|nr:autotransporter outer membrane beta-barrel domain-containing protein [Nitrospinaceae bacterium]NIR55181.1 autotransporter outer membrane beta-barrel domain-containing protein [Nitrospinaceae bacterium]NIT82451.1 autotransporter outer membrane beta-barrel domain-containing protein [Nitrospinaceae bacterium]NIU44664.1 autotransporter outer membrane beta-barrel domain-containing protein [Nitrospinaceae bacterium]NIU96822.1 autotransporter domain-containing protein [Nitrospinaceae bacterium]